MHRLLIALVVLTVVNPGALHGEGHGAVHGEGHGAVHREGAREETATALEAALGERGIEGAWIGRMASVGSGRRDVIVWMPEVMDAAKPIDVVVYFEGYGSFAKGAMDRRHAAAIEEVAAAGNAVYVAPDAPSSSHARDPKWRGPYWRAGCDGSKRCRGGVSAPGDFVVFLGEIFARVREAWPDAELRLSLVGFSNGGKGVSEAVAQLAKARGEVRLDTVGLRQIVFADAIYGQAWLDGTWSRVGELAGFERLVLLLIDGPLREDGHGPGAKNRANARVFLREVAPDLDLSSRETLSSGPIEVVRLDESHHAIGNLAVGYLSLGP